MLTAAPLVFVRNAGTRTGLLPLSCHAGEARRKNRFLALGSVREAASIIVVDFSHVCTIYTWKKKKDDNTAQQKVYKVWLKLLHHVHVRFLAADESSGGALGLVSPIEMGHYSLAVSAVSSTEKQTACSLIIRSHEITGSASQIKASQIYTKTSVLLLSASMIKLKLIPWNRYNNETFSFKYRNTLKMCRLRVKFLRSCHFGLR